VKPDDYVAVNLENVYCNGRFTMFQLYRKKPKGATLVRRYFAPGYAKTPTECLEYAMTEISKHV
jgi:hypothetical protein